MTTLTDNEKLVLVKDYMAWTGGFYPDEDDRHEIYMEFAMPHSFVGKKSEVRKFLRSYVQAKKLIKAEKAEEVKKAAEKK